MSNIVIFIGVALIGFLLFLNRPAHASYHYGYRALEIDSSGGNMEQFFSQRRYMVKNHIAPRIHVCESACTIFLSVPGACVYHDATLGFHQAYSGLMRPDRQIDITGPAPFETSRMWKSYPEIVKRIVGWPMTQPPAMKMVSGYQLIQAGYPSCG